MSIAGTLRSTAASLGAALLVLASSAWAGDGWLDSYRGRWAGPGRFMGNDARYQVTVEPVLEARFIRLSVRYSWREADGSEASFSGEALYPAQSAPAVRGAWFDSEGHQYATSAYRAANGAVIVHWGEGEMRGRSEYRLHGAGELEVTDSFARAGEWQRFSHARLARAADQQ